MGEKLFPGCKTEEEIAGLARNGNEDASEYLIRKYKNLVKIQAHRYFIMGADRDDIVQEGMIGVFNAIQSFDETRNASFSTFAELCVNRRILSAIKAAARGKHSPLNTSVSLSNPVSEKGERSTLAETLSCSSDSDPEAVFLLKEAVSRIDRGEKGGLSETEQKVWTEYLKGKSYREIGELLGKSPKAVDNAIQRTKRKLAAYLDQNRVD
ncbi:MAG: RNA polymerase factor sigma-70 [Anaerovoracaceae bacterium]|nr:RNA polymerase factor sigma-70 [Bacillota bacterium]MDY3954746.1 RNA polymerase factor sigma-70 [Anaerovoracaceae bacterium]